MAFAIEHEKFKGPLHFLLEEIEKERMSIGEFALAQITDAFLAYIKTLPLSAQEEISEFLVIASRLLLIKSRTLLPQLPLSKEEELSIDELQNRLNLLQKIRERAADLGTILKQKRYLYERESMRGVSPVFYPPAALTADDLAEVFRAVLDAIPAPKTLASKEIKNVISLEEKIVELQESLQMRAEELFSNIIKHSQDTTEIIVNFLAILELAKQKIVNIDQSEAFGDITIKRISKRNRDNESNG